MEAESYHAPLALISGALSVRTKRFALDRKLSGQSRPEPRAVRFMPMDTAELADRRSPQVNSVSSPVSRHRREPTRVLRSLLAGA